MNDQIEDRATIDEGTTAPAEPKFDGMSNREALEKAIGEKRERPEPEAVPTSKEVKAAVTSDPEPPSEFSETGKKAWREKDFAGVQSEFRRVHDARTQELGRSQTAERRAREEAQREREEAKTWRELGKMAAPYIESRGQDGVTPDKAIMEALALINEFRKGDPATVKAELRKIGIDLDKAPGAKPSEPDNRIDTLQKSVDELRMKEEGRHLEKVAQTFESVFSTLTSQKTRTGECVFPDLLDNSDAGKQFAHELGSLTADKRFLAGVHRRLPDADLTTVVREAYKYLGGRVSGEPVKVSSQSNQQHIDKSRRAAASTPGRVVARNEASNLVGKLSPRAALARAIAEHKEH